MSFKPDEKDWMAYLYGELEGIEKERIERYLEEHPEAREHLAKLNNLRALLSQAEDKEVIAPPIVIDSGSRRFLWNIPYVRTIISIAASLLVVILVGKATDARVSFDNNEFRLSFGEPKTEPATPKTDVEPRLTAGDVQEMINASLAENNSNVEATIKRSQANLTASIRRNLDDNSGKIDALMRQVVTASQDQVRQYVTSMQAENMQMVKDYFQLSSAEQKTYIEDILVDFSQYMQQQRNNDLQVIQTQLSSLQKNTDVFKQETEQILTSIISSVGTQPITNETRN